MSGGVRVVINYADRLRKRGHQVYIVHKRFPSIPLRSHLAVLIKERRLLASEKCRISDFGIVDLPHRTIHHAGPIVDSDVPDADIVVATWWETVPWVANLSAQKGVKVHFVQHHEVFDYLPIDQVKAAYRIPMHRIAVAQWLVDILKEKYGEKRVALVPNGIEARRFQVPPRNKNVTPTVGIFYSALRWKGCDICIAAFQQAAQRIPNLRLIAFGAIPPSPDLKLPPSTIYYRRPANACLPAIYAQCDAWLFGSRSEGFGLPLLEAMTCRTPLIATAAGAAPELLKQGGGFLLEQEDVKGMAAAIETISRCSPRDWRILSNAAHATAMAYTLDDAALAFEQALESAVIHHRESICGL
jgi:glycosyltransferase involved in cell wall biosynthesis